MILDKETPKIGRRFLAPPRSPQRQARGIAFMLLLPLLLLHLLLCVTLAMRESRARWMPTSVGPAPGAPRRHPAHHPSDVQIQGTSGPVEGGSGDVGFVPPRGRVSLHAVDG